MSTPADLPLALLAVQRGLIDYRHLLSAWADWASDPGRPLSDLLVERGLLLAEQRHELRRIVGSAPVADDTSWPETVLGADPGVASTTPPVGPWGSGWPVGLDGRYRRTRLHAQGGMGDVWLARDERLDRVVALKELQPHWQGEEQMRARFLAEAKVTGQLEHPGIVPVYDLVQRPGEPASYTMRLVRGRTLAEAVWEHHRKAADPLGLRELLGAFVSVCQTLAYAHSRGVIHRDLKPANVILGPYGEVLVLDWGLAKLTGTASGGREAPVDAAEQGADAPRSPDRTAAGDVVGTPAYMPPEQAQGHVHRVDRRSDVFGLGAILYEILTGRAPYAGADVLQQARACRWPPARSVNRSVAASLEAVCHKALAPRPEDRYQSALELGDEVKRWLADEPVRAHREPWTVRTSRWVRRRRVFASSTAAALAVALVLGSAGAAFWHFLRLRAREQAEDGLAQATELRRAYRFGDAEAMLRQVGGWLDQAADPRLQGKLAAARRDLELARELDGVRQRATFAIDGRWDPGRARAEYPAVFARYEYDVLNGDIEELARRIRESPVWRDIVEALDDWALYAETDRRQVRRLLRLSLAADAPDPWRQAVRRAILRGDQRRLRQLARRAGEGEPTPGVALMLGSAYPLAREEVTTLLRGLQRARPNDFWVSFALGEWYSRARKHREAAASYLAAAALRPHSAVAHTNLAGAFRAAGEVDEAIACCRKAVEIDPGLPLAHVMLGAALWDRKRFDDAIASARRALAIDPRLAAAHTNLGNALHDKGKLDEAIAHHRKAIGLDPRLAVAHTNLGNALRDKGNLTGAIACHRKAVEIDPGLAVAHSNLGVALRAAGEVDEAIACHRKALAINPSFASAHLNLGAALHTKGHFPDAIASFRKAIELEPRDAKAHSNLGGALRDSGRVAEAIAAFRKALALDPTLARTHGILGLALQEAGKLDDAVASHQTALRLAPTDALAHNDLGLALAARGEWRRAADSHRKAIELDPRLAVAHANLGRSLRALGDREGALAAHRKAVELGPHDARFHVNLGAVLHAARRRKEAEACFRQAIALDPRLAVAHANLGVALRDNGKTDEAIAYWRTALALHPRDADTHHRLGIALRDRGRTAEALPHFRAAVTINPGLAKAQANLGFLLLGEGEVEEAIPCLRRALAIDPALAQCHGALGEALMRRGELAEARESLRRCLALLPRTAQVRGGVAGLVRQCEGWIEAERDLAAFRAGRGAPANAARQLLLADLARQPFKSLPLTAARLYRDAFAREPRLATDLGAGHRFHAACCAALAGCGRGNDGNRSGEADRAAWRHQALAWLHADLAWWTRSLLAGPPTQAARARQVLDGWRRTADLAGVRDREAIARLPLAEKVGWRKLWAEVDDLLAPTRGNGAG